MSFLEDMAPAAEQQARRQRRKGAARRAALAQEAKEAFEEEMFKRRFGAFAFADQGGHISRVLKKPYTNLVRGGQLVQVLRIEALEGLGTSEGLFTEENPSRRVVYWYEADGTLIARRDPQDNRPVNFMTPAKPDRV